METRFKTEQEVLDHYVPIMWKAQHLTGDIEAYKNALGEYVGHVLQVKIRATLRALFIDELGVDPFTETAKQNEAV